MQLIWLCSIRKYGDVWDPKKCLAMLTQHESAVNKFDIEFMIELRGIRK